MDYYNLLSVSRTASAAQIKAAYRHALFRTHPDKTRESNVADISLIKEAYEALSSPSSRAEYDSKLQATGSYEEVAAGPRPAQVISLDEFEEKVASVGSGDDPSCWHHPCRCGGRYTITSAAMENGYHLVSCCSCSEIVWVAYEVVEDD